MFKSADIAIKGSRNLNGRNKDQKEIYDSFSVRGICGKFPESGKLSLPD